jgi:hypothetical protein
VIRHVMPWLATRPGDVTLLSARGRRLTKLITPERILEYDGAALFHVDARRLEGLEDVAELLAELAGMSSSCAVRAALKAPVGTFSEVRCRIHDRDGQPALFGEVPRQWVMVDLEPTACPVDPVDPILVGGWLRRRLPAPFQSARCAVQLSSSAGVKPGARAHCWFWLDRALVRAELERLLAGVEGLDASTLRSRQFHYTASPLFAGVDDPCHERIALLPGHAEVAVPDLSPPPPRQAFSIGVGGRGGGGAERYAAACLRRLALAPEGQRHRTCLTVSCRLLALAKGGEIDPIRVGAMIKGVMQGKGFDGRGGRGLGEVDKILEWAWRTVQPERLPR